jgi:uncharacterized protein (TIGR02145 family)
MPIRKIKAQSPDPYLGKIQGDTELARLAHLNYVIDAINNGSGGGGGGSLTVNGNPNITNLNISPILSTSTSPGEVSLTIDVPDPLPYKAYRAKIATQTIDWPGYGYLYNWYAVDDARGLANPSGGTGLTAPNEWRVPSDTDWSTLETFAGGSSVAGGKLKSTLTSTAYPFYGWLNNGGGTDDYKFNALGGGYRGYNGPSILVFSGIGISGLWWSSTSANTTVASGFNLQSLFPFTNLSTFDKFFGLSVRLVRQATAGELLLNDGDTSDTSSLDPYTGNDGKTYVTVKIGTQVWLAQNLRETKYNDNSDIFNASILFGGDLFNGTWQAKGAAQEGAWTAYMYVSGTTYVVEYNPFTATTFYNDVLENTLGTTNPYPFWYFSSDVNGPRYVLDINRPWNKTHIKITPGYDVSDFPIINERSLLIEYAVEGDNTIAFRPIKRDNTGAITIEDLNNYNDLLGGVTSYVYVEILEYLPAYYGSGLSVAVGASNLEDEEEIVALTYEINGVTYTEDLEAKKLSIEIAKIYEQLGIFDKYKV